MKSKLIKLLKENKSLIVFILLMSIFRSAFADWNTVPSGSMKPTLIEGDRILVNKMAYDLRVPFTHLSLVKLADPKRGDIIIFDSKVSEMKLVKRVVAIPGDIVSLENNKLRINGELLQYQDIADKDQEAAQSDQHVNKQTTDRLESSSFGEYGIRINNQGSELSSFSAVKVPQDHYLALGDNRDNSSDSRVIGFVPRAEIVGRTQSVVMSFNYDNFYLPRAHRFLHTL